MWRQISNAQIEQLLAQAWQHNPNLQASRAQAKIRESSRRQNLARMLPSLSLNINESSSPYDSLGFQTGVMRSIPAQQNDEDNPMLYSSGSAMLKANWTADIWGRGLLEYHASDLEAQAARLDDHFQNSNLSSQLALAYYDVVTAQEQRKMLHEQRQRSQTLLELVTARAETGSSSVLDVLQQRQQLASLDAQISPVDSLILSSQMQLAELAGLASIKALPSIDGALPSIKTEWEPSLLDSLAGRRTDLRAAALKAEASQARVRAAIRSPLPTLSLQGQAGLQANYTDKLTGQNTWSLGAALSWPIDLVGLQSAKIQQAEANALAISAQYRSQQLAVRFQTRRALVNLQAQQKRAVALDLQRQAAELSYGEAKHRYLAGLETYLSVLSSLASLQQIELALLLARHDLLKAQINTIRAIGLKPHLETAQ